MRPPDLDPAGSDAKGHEENRRIAQLIEQARGGDVAAFATLYSSTARWLLSHVRRMVDDSHAEDVLAEVYIQVWNSLATYDQDRAAPRVWLVMIARARALDHLRREKRRSEVHDDAQMQALPALDGFEGPEQLALRAEQCRMVRSSLAGAGLSVDEQQVVGLAYFRDSTHREIAMLTGWPLGTVKSLMRRAQDKLRAFLIPPSFTATPPWCDARH